MTSVEAIDAIEQWILDAGLISGYTIRAFTYTGNNLIDDVPLCLIRKSGNGNINSNIREIDYMLTLFDTAENIVSLSNYAAAIGALSETTTYPAGVSKCRLLVSSSDPSETENGLYACFLQIRLTVEL